MTGPFSGNTDVMSYINFKPNDDSKLSGTKTDNGIIFTVSQKDPKTSDTIAKSWEINIEKGTIAGVPSSPKEPLLSKPKSNNISSTSSADSGTGVDNTTDTYNPLYQKAFLAAFFGMMDKIMSMESQNRSQLAFLAIETNQDVLDMVKTGVQQTLNSYSQKQKDLITQAASAGIGVAIAVHSLSGAAKALSESTQDAGVVEMDRQITELENKKNGIAAGGSQNQSTVLEAAAEFDGAGNPVINDPALDIDDLPPPPPFTDEDQKNLDKLKIEREQTRSSVQARSIEATRNLGEIFRGINDTFASSLRAHFQGKEGQIEAIKQAIQGYQSATERYLNTTSSARDSQKQALSQLADMLVNVVNTIINSLKMA